MAMAQCLLITLMVASVFAAVDAQASACPVPASILGKINYSSAKASCEPFSTAVCGACLCQIAKTLYTGLSSAGVQINLQDNSTVTQFFTSCQSDVAVALFTTSGVRPADLLQLQACPLSSIPSTCFASFIPASPSPISSPSPRPPTPSPSPSPSPAKASPNVTKADSPVPATYPSPPKTNSTAGAASPAAMPMPSPAVSPAYAPSYGNMSAGGSPPAYKPTAAPPPMHKPPPSIYGGGPLQQSATSPADSTTPASSAPTTVISPPPTSGASGVQMSWLLIAGLSLLCGAIPALASL